jgi:hypothetical protein
MSHCVVWQRYTDVSEVLAAAIVRAIAVRRSTTQKTAIFTLAAVRN